MFDGKMYTYQLTDLREDGMNNTEEVEKTVNDTLQTMKNLTSTTTEMSAGDIHTSLDIIEAVVDVLSLSGATIEKKVSLWKGRCNALNK